MPPLLLLLKLILLEERNNFIKAAKFVKRGEKYSQSK